MIATICLQDWNLWPTITAAPPFNLSRATELVIPAQSHDVPARNSDEFKAGPKETPLLDDVAILISCSGVSIAKGMRRSFTL